MEWMEKRKRSAAPAREPTGIPAQMKRSFEERSGLSFDDVRVHYSSAKPAKLGALAYTQGAQVFLGPGQERYLPHELGHVVQQKRGLVRPTGMFRGVPVNTDPRLEREADRVSATGAQAAPMREGVVQRAGIPGVGIELETSTVLFHVVRPPKKDEAAREEDEEARKESYWKGMKMVDFSKEDGKPPEEVDPTKCVTAGITLRPQGAIGNWALTIDTTTFYKEEDYPHFTSEIVVDGTKLELDPKRNTLAEIGVEIRKTLLEYKWIPQLHYLVGDKVLEIRGKFSPETIFSIQVTCGIPLSLVSDLLYAESPLNHMPMVKPSPVAAVPEGTDPEVDTFLALFISMFNKPGVPNSDDPKQKMSIMPRTSYSKMFSLFSDSQQRRVLEQLHSQKGLGTLAGLDGITFNSYIDHFQKLYKGEVETSADPLAVNKEECLGIGQLGDIMDRDLSGTGENPIFEFRKVGGCTLRDLPQTLGVIHDELLKVLTSQKPGAAPKAG